ncbi:MAG: hypothetical protein A3F70_02290 [Acidobacteria bacterium RIFCSPLOWO2_12_FULL_67_14]|nr:MAG: hypothetical protein A3F70_02290 [Acidobacteria bacterium RIFCSPLOWO2_12_FULL_67_14]
MAGTFSWTPTAGQVGTYGINFEVVANYASPPQLADSEFVQIVVAAANLPPVLEEIANQRVGADPLNIDAFVAQPSSFDALATDPNAGDVLTYSTPILIGPNGTSVLPSELGVSVDHAFDAIGRRIGRLMVAPDAGDLGVWQLRVRVDDGKGGSDEQNTFISVGTFTNQSPVFTEPPPAEVFGLPGSEISFPVTAADPDGAHLVTLATAGGSVRGLRSCHCRRQARSPSFSSEVQRRSPSAVPLSD